MTTDYRDLITRMANELDEYQRMLLDDCTVTHRLSNEARAALGEADEPAVPQGREPAAVTGQPRPMDEDWDALVNRLWSKYETIGYQGERFMYEGDFCTALDLVRQEIARLGNPAPQLPTDGEVAEVMGLFRHWAEAYPDSVTVDPYWLTRAADLLQRLNPPQPVPVSERLPGPEDCAAEGRCWWGRDESDYWSADWTLATPEAVAEFREFSPQTVWIPAHALPVPEMGE